MTWITKLKKELTCGWFSIWYQIQYYIPSSFLYDNQILQCKARRNSLVYVHSHTIINHKYGDIDPYIRKGFERINIDESSHEFEHLIKQPWQYVIVIMSLLGFLSLPSHVVRERSVPLVLTWYSRICCVLHATIMVSE